jgi:DNA-binding MarR family transcriptional regulator
LARRERDAGDRRKTLVSIQPAVLERAAPLFEPMERTAMAVLSKYRDDELVLLLDFLTRARDAALAAMSELRAPPGPRATTKLPKPK